MNDENESQPPPPVLVTVVATCECDGCDNFGIPVVLEVDAASMFIICGPCGQQITAGTEEVE